MEVFNMNANPDTGKIEKTAILVDTGSDISDDLVRQYGMKRLSLHVLYPEKDYSDGVDISPQTIYERFPAEIPTTSTPGPQEVRDMLDSIKAEGYTHVLAVAISSGLSGTYNTICSVLKEETELVSYVLDSRSISFGAGVLAVWAAKKLAEGMSFDEVTALLPDKVKDSKIFYCMDTLTYLQKGGRIGLVTSIVGNILNLKPIISCNEDGVYYTAAKSRGSRQGLSKLLEEAKNFAGDGPVWFSLLNGDASAAAAGMLPRLQKALPNGTLILDKQITASMAVHTGPGLLGIGILKNP